MSIKSILNNTCGNLEQYIREIIEVDDTIIIRFYGDIDASTLPCVRLRMAEDKHEFIENNILADFNDVKHVDTATLAVICEMLKQLRRNDKKFGIINASQQFCNYLEILNLTEKVIIFDSEEKALKELSV